MQRTRTLPNARGQSKARCQTTTTTRTTRMPRRLPHEACKRTNCCRQMNDAKPMPGRERQTTAFVTNNSTLVLTTFGQVQISANTTRRRRLQPAELPWTNNVDVLHPQTQHVAPNEVEVPCNKLHYYKMKNQVNSTFWVIKEMYLEYFYMFIILFVCCLAVRGFRLFWEAQVRTCCLLEFAASFILHASKSSNGNKYKHPHKTGTTLTVTYQQFARELWPGWRITLQKKIFPVFIKFFFIF